MWLTKWSRTPVSPSSSIFISPPLADITLLIKDRIVKAVVFPVVMYRCEIWTIKKAEHWRINAFEVCSRRLESPLDCKEIKPVNPKGNQPWIFIGRTDAAAEAPILWPPDAKSWLFGKDPDAGKDRRQEEKGTTEDEMVGWHHWLNGHEFEQTMGNNKGQGSLACSSPWGCKELDTTELLNNSKGLYSSSYDFSSSHVQIWELDHKEGGAPKNWCSLSVLGKTLETVRR